MPFVRNRIKEKSKFPGTLISWTFQVFLHSFQIETHEYYWRYYCNYCVYVLVCKFLGTPNDQRQRIRRFDIFSEWSYKHNFDFTAMKMIFTQFMILF